MLIHCRRPAMATWFEIWLAGDDAEHLTAVGESVLDRVAQVEQLLSRFDPTSEVARLNREAAHRPVRVDRELLAILLDCRRWYEQTEGYFDVRAATGERSPRAPFAETVLFEEETRTIRFLDPTIALDFGGYGKGYALDQGLRILQEFGVASALIHGGTSSVLARGVAEDGQPWRVGVRDPWAQDREIAQLPLKDCAMSSSAVFHPGASASDLRDPTQGRLLAEPAACVVLAPSAAEAEVYSTALLAMGHTRARTFVKEHLSGDHRVAWLQDTRLVWLTDRTEESNHD